jgi:Tol biopolymer transport system component
MASSRGDRRPRGDQRLPWLAVSVLALLPLARAADTVLASATALGASGNGDSGSIFGRQSITPNGRFITFESSADDLTVHDVNHASDVFVRDRKQGSTTMVSVIGYGYSAAGASFNSRISANGRYVAWQSVSDELVGGDTNEASDIFVRDLKKGLTTCVSVDSAGALADGSSFNPWISGNGRYVVFQSDATNLVAGDTNGKVDVFVHDRKQGTTARVSLGPAGAEADADCLGATISTNGRFVAFESAATNLVADDTNGASDVFLRDLLKGVTVRVSVDAAGAQGDGGSAAAMISGGGRYVAFSSVATNLVPDDLGGVADIFVRDLKKSTVERLSVDAAEAGGDGLSNFPWITPNGRFVGFQSAATNLVPGDTNGVPDVFLVDRKKDTRQRVSVDAAGVQGDGESARAAVSANGRFVAFDSDAANLVASDTNGFKDVFVRDLK